MPVILYKESAYDWSSATAEPLAPAFVEDKEDKLKGTEWEKEWHLRKRWSDIGGWKKAPWQHNKPPTGNRCAMRLHNFYITSTFYLHFI